MTRTVIVILFLNIMLSVCGQEFNTHWIYAPQTDSTSHVWFRRGFITDGRPRRATVTVTTTGYYKLYVNECNVGTALYHPLREGGDTTAIATSFDITSYLRPDSNVIALIYSPSVIRSGTCRQTHRQVSVNIYGQSHNDSAFSYYSDGSWLCRRANSRMTSDGGELVDGREHDPSWKANTIYNQALWIHAMESSDEVNGYGNSDYNVEGQQDSNSNKAFYVSHIMPYTSDGISLTDDKLTAIILPIATYGFLRATIREARYGEEMSIGNIHYICNGSIDEQAYPQFSLGTYSTILLTGDSHFRTSQIMSLEAVSVYNKNIF